MEKAKATPKPGEIWRSYRSQFYITGDNHGRRSGEAGS